VLGLAMIGQGGTVTKVHPTVVTVKRLGLGVRQQVSLQYWLALETKKKNSYET
jgi:hypothetical protein